LDRYFELVTAVREALRGGHAPDAPGLEPESQLRPADERVDDARGELLP
jgi:hypothetical protein